MLVLRGALNILSEDKPLLLLEAEMPNHAKFRPRVREFEEYSAQWDTGVCRLIMMPSLNWRRSALLSQVTRMLHSFTTRKRTV